MGAMTMQEQIIRDREVHSCYTFDFVRLQYHNFFQVIGQIKLQRNACHWIDGMALYAIQ